MNNTKRILIVLFLVGVSLRVVDLWHPVNGEIRESWRECDYAAIARNYVEEGLNILYPRIDWRDDGPGFAEMEFPIIPWTIAVLYKYLGFNEIYGKLLSFLFSILTMLLFLHFARSELSDDGVIFSFMFFILSPLTIYISNTLQPEGLMFCAYLLAVILFKRWVDEEEPWTFFTAIIVTALALLVKINTLHIGLIFLYILFEKRGWDFLKDFRIWVFVILALLPAIIWYYHAHQLWLIYHKSLGVSNETHWIGLDLLWNPAILVGIIKIEVLNVWMPFSFLPIIFFLFRNSGNRLVKLNIIWLSTIFLYYFAAARTTGDEWAKYYHVVSAAPFSLLVGMSSQYILKLLDSNFYRYFLLSVSVFGLVWFLFIKLFADVYFSLVIYLAVLILLIMVLVYIVYSRSRNADYSAYNLFGNRISGRIIALVLLFTLGASYLSAAFRSVQILKPDYMKPHFECAQIFQKYIPENVLILCSGGYGFDDTGKPVAYNAPYYFYWLKRKGFNISREDQSITEVENFRQRGAAFYVAEIRELNYFPEFEAALKRKYKLVAKCNAALLFDLNYPVNEKINE